MQRSAFFQRYSVFHLGCLVTILMLAITGFAQMPIFKRYYVADLPAMGWLARFYVTHYLHYLFGALFIGLGTYAATVFLLKRKSRDLSPQQLTASGALRIGLLAALVLSGGLMVVKNLPGQVFPPNLIVGLNLTHLGLVMAFLAASLYAVLCKRKWAKGGAQDAQRKAQ